MTPDPRIQTCALCPKLCRHSCPVAVATGREASTPTAIMTTLLRWHRDEVEPEQARLAATLCTNCGSCETTCGIEQPVIKILREVRAQLVEPMAAKPLQKVEGGATYVAIECDDRNWAAALAAHLGRGVARLQTHDHLGADRLDHPQSATEHLVGLRDRLGGRVAIVSCHRCESAVKAAGIDTLHLQTLCPMPISGTIHHPCHGPRLEGDTPASALACCGASGPLRHTHPEAAMDVKAQAVLRLGTDSACSPDTQCAQHLRSGGLNVIDPVSHLLTLVNK